MSWLLGKNSYGENIYLRDFTWDCGWYWSGGYLGNRNCHYHFESYGKDTNYFDGFKKDIVESNLTDKQLWRLCDLMKQFYAYKNAAECFQYGGHYTAEDRSPSEIVKDNADLINKHIETVIIPEVRNLMNSVVNKS